jgi:hypothetical protein
MITFTKLSNKQCLKLTLTVGRGRSLYGINMIMYGLSIKVLAT